jgi:hypothetical protein
MSVSGWIPPHDPTRMRVSAPTRANSSTAMAAEGEPIPVDVTDIGVPSSVPVAVRYSRWSATTVASSHSSVTVSTRSGSPGRRTASATSSSPTSRWYWVSASPTSSSVSSWLSPLICRGARG